MFQRRRKEIELVSVRPSCPPTTCGDTTSSSFSTVLEFDDPLGDIKVKHVNWEEKSLTHRNKQFFGMEVGF